MGIYIKTLDQEIKNKGVVSWISILMLIIIFIGAYFIVLNDPIEPDLPLDDDGRSENEEVTIGPGDEIEVNGHIGSIGIIVSRKDTSDRYVLTASHVFGDNPPDNPESVGSVVKHDGVEIGIVSHAPPDYIDAGLIKLNSNVVVEQDFDVVGYKEPYKGLNVFKIGHKTGKTYGEVSDTNIRFDDKEAFEVVSISGSVFSQPGDSGSAIITRSEPYKLVGIISTSGGKEEEGSTSHVPSDIVESLNIEFDSTIYSLIDELLSILE